MLGLLTPMLRRRRKFLITIIIILTVIFTHNQYSNVVPDLRLHNFFDNKYLGRFLPSQEKPLICVLVLACNRPSVKRCLDSVFKHRLRTPSVNFPVIVSQDCGSHPETTGVIKSYGSRLVHIHQPDLRDITTDGSTKEGYYKATRHHGWALKQAFNEFKCPNVIVLEDDIEVAPDFFEYFAATLPIYLKDPSILCVTASNIQAKPDRVNTSANTLLHRTDYFFGWGWMITKKVFQSLGPWPEVYWDVWLGLPDERAGRSCIRPEIPRTTNFGRDGTSGHTFYDERIRDLVVNEEFVPFTNLNLSYLLYNNYNNQLNTHVSQSILIRSLPMFESGLRNNKYPPGSEFRISYGDHLEFQKLAKYFNLYGLTWNGISHTMYRGIMTFMHRDHRIYLVPSGQWKGYDSNVDMFN